ncbi:MAG: o-succinylbenzoate--CoA ligase [Ignavibacteria bacterium]
MFFARLLEHPPTSAAVFTGNKFFTYSDLVKEIKFSVHSLKYLDISRGDHVGIIRNNEIHFISLVFALWNCGAVPVLLNAKLSNNEIHNQVLFTGCKSVFIHHKFIKELSFPEIKTVEFPFAEKIEAEESFSFKESKPDDTAVIIFTSGSSGKPKAVELSFENLLQSAVIGNKVLKLNSMDRFLASLPFYHIGGFSIIIRAVLFGSSVIIPESLSAEELIKSITLYNPTAASLVSNQLKIFVEKKIIPPKELRLVLLGGGFFNMELVLEAMNQGWKIAKVYGTTETSSFIAFMNYEESGLRPGASGKAINPNRIMITKEGEIGIISPAVMKGYYNNKEETSLKLKDGIFYSGDIGYIDQDGYLYIEAKRNDLIVSGGENINPAEVEKEISAHPKVNEAAVVGIEDKEWGQAVSAAIVVRQEENLSEDELKNFLKYRIASFKIPKKVVFLNELPKTELGKVQKEKVREFFNK